MTRWAAALALVLLAGCTGEDPGSDAGSGGTDDDTGSTCAEGLLPCNDECLPPFEPTLANVHGQVLQGCTAAACHGDAGPAENLVVTTPAQAHMNMVGIPSLQNPALSLVEPGDPDGSYLLAKLSGVGMAEKSSTGGPSVRMPIGFPATCDARLSLVQAWIAAGAPDQ